MSRYCRSAKVLRKTFGLLAMALGLVFACFAFAQTEIIEFDEDGEVKQKPKASKPLPFDHSTTGFELVGSHSFIACESCHVGGRFNGTPRECVVCHSLNGLVNATPKTANHVLTTDDCMLCHNATLWDDVIRVDHSQTFGSCDSCHNNFSAEGKPPTHLPTSQQCDNCHSNLVWIPARFSHAGINSGCIGCHNGATATGKHPGHITSSDNCEFCHSTAAWVPANVNHSQVVGVCSSCHNGVVATGKHAGHIPTTAECDVCHNTASWNIGTMRSQSRFPESSMQRVFRESDLGGERVDR